MSFEGTGGAGVAVGAAGALAVGAVVGLGILAVRGIMWCGKKMEENYERSRQEWRSLHESAYAASRANVQDMPSVIAWEVERIAAANANLTLSTMPTMSSNTPSPAQKELMDALARARASLENAQNATQIKAETGRELLAYRLKSEIEAARGLLPADKIALAETALSGSVQVIRNALQMLQNAWQATTNVQVVNTHQERKARQIINSINAQLSAIDIMLHNAGKAQNPAYASHKREIENKVGDAQYALAHDPAHALSVAEEAQREVQELTRLVSTDTMSAWDQARRKAIALQGTLDSLTTMTKEAVALKLIDAQYAQNITRRVSAAQVEAQALTQGVSATMQQRFVLLNERVEMLKEEVFRLVKTKQQNQLAQTIATTLAELGFQSNVGGLPVIQENGDVARIVATRSGGTPNFKRDDKLVSFDVSRDGNISYDFSGYVGNACVIEAKEVFAALRRKGVFILDDRAMDDLRKIPAENVTVDTLRQERFAPYIVQNKLQAELAERLKEVFERMKFTNVQQSVVGGSIDIEAFNGPLGYHVVLPPDGSAQVYKNHADVSSDTMDPIVSEVSREPEEVLGEVEVDERARSAERRRYQAELRRQQMLEQ